MSDPSKPSRLNSRSRAERRFESVARVVVRRRWAVIATVALVTAFWSSWIPAIRIDNSLEGYLIQDDAETQRYNRFRDQFGRSDTILVLIRNVDVFDSAFLRRLHALHREIASVPYVEDVTSLINVRDVRGQEGRLVVEGLLAEHRWPESPRELNALRERVLSTPLYVHNLVSPDGSAAVLIVRPHTYSASPVSDPLAGFEADATPAEPPSYLSEDEERELVRALGEVLERQRTAGLEVYGFGGPTFDARIADLLDQDVRRFLGLAFVVVALVALLLFRTVLGLVAPLLVVLASVATTMGVMVYLGIPISVTMQILPAFLVVVGVCDTMHILVIFYQKLEVGLGKEEATIHALGHSGLPVFMTSLTTAFALTSFMVAELAPIRDLGVIAPLGVLVAMVYSLTLLPALLVVSPLRRPTRPGNYSHGAYLNRVLAGAADLSVRHPRRVLGVTALIVVFACFSAAQLRFSHDPLTWLPEDEPLRVAAEAINRDLGGAGSLEVLIDTGVPNGLLEPEALHRLEAAVEAIQKVPLEGRTLLAPISFLDIVKETHRALNGNRQEFYAIPDERRVIAQELLLFESGDPGALRRFADAQRQTARLTLRLPWVDATHYRDFIAELRGRLDRVLGPEIRYELTGLALLMSGVFLGVIESLYRSYLVALALIVPTLVLLVGNLSRGLAAVVPNLIPVLLVLALMGAADLPLDTSNLLVGSIVLGLAVDDTIHFMHTFGGYFEEWGDVRRAVRQTMLTTGSALLFTTLVLAVGFAVFSFGCLRNAVHFGILTSFATVVAFLADVLVTPALLALFARRRE